MNYSMAKRKTSLGCLFWIALILLVLVVFFFNRNRIATVLEETGFSDYLFQESPEEPDVTRVSPEEDAAPAPKEEQEITVPSREQEEEEKPGEDSIEPDIQAEEEQRKEDPADSEEPLIEKRLRKSAIYFVKVNNEGEIELQKIIRPVYYSSSPLTETLKVLLEGLTAEELNQGLLNLIPQETKLNRVWISDGVAYIDFSEALRFNQFGSEGLTAELRQIVYTATEFQTVNAVQILINGEKLDYLSSEGIYVGEPLSRQQTY